MTEAILTSIDTNQQSLVAALAQVRAALEYAGARANGEAVDPPIERTDLPAAPTLDRLCAAFALSPFERDVLLLCAGIELDGAFAGLCAAAHGDPSRTYPTWSLALLALPAPHWSALTPAGPLRRWRLIEAVAQPPTPLTHCPLRIDERVLHFLTGIQYLDERLAGLIEPVVGEDELVPSHRALADEIAAIWGSDPNRPPLIELCGPEDGDKRAVAAAACDAVGLHLCALAADMIPAHGGELDGLLRLWEREAALLGAALYVQADMIDAADPRAVATVARFAERVRGPLLLGTRDRWPPWERTAYTLDVARPTAAEQRALWNTALGDDAAQLNGQVDHLVAQFNLSTPAIRASAQAGQIRHGDEPLAARLWDASRSQARPRLDTLAQRIVPAATWRDLVLPAAERSLLEEIAIHLRQRATVYDAWGWSARSSRGLGISALFAGASGTGKTMAAEVLAHDLRLDLYRIDLASVVSKYIGETEKNLRRVFDAAEHGGAILFFDEADALFGKRSEVKDSHDRYANIEINYLLQRMEAYRGLAILATNMKSALDGAFLRRIRFVINFPFPDATQRAEIWRRIFPPATPTDDLLVPVLARLNVAGGNIRNIALNAAFLAAEANEPVRMTHLLHAARHEYAKLEKPLTDAEIGGWR